jgi:hypothetical protein
LDFLQLVHTVLTTPGKDVSPGIWTGALSGAAIAFAATSILPRKPYLRPYHGTASEVAVLTLSVLAGIAIGGIVGGIVETWFP